jgi:hypothetical protein
LAEDVPCRQSRCGDRPDHAARTKPHADSQTALALRQTRELLGTEQVRDAVRAAPASAAGLTGPASSVAADAVLQAIADSLPPEHVKERAWS